MLINAPDTKRPNEPGLQKEFCRIDGHGTIEPAKCYRYIAENHDRYDA